MRKLFDFYKPCLLLKISDADIRIVLLSKTCFSILHAVDIFSVCIT